MQNLMDMLFAQQGQQQQNQGVVAPAQTTAAGQALAQPPAPAGGSEPWSGQPGNALPGQSDGSSPGTDKVAEALLAATNPQLYRMTQMKKQPQPAPPIQQQQPYGSM